MNYDDEWPDQTWDNRRKAIRKTIRPATLEELQQIGEKRFPFVTDPWCERFNLFLRENPDAKFFIAASPEGAEVIYCRDTGQGVWFLPGKGMGIIQPKGLQLLAEITDGL